MKRFFEINKLIIVKAFGLVLIVVGISGIFLPILPGWILIFIGLEFIGIQLVFVQKFKEYAKNKVRKSKKEVE